ncbi:MAG: DeoR family transcriptional regulator [Candidatus Bathyarchaeia archaeon]
MKKMLEYISEKGYIKVDEISQLFDVPKSFVEHIIQELTRKSTLKCLIPKMKKLHVPYVSIRMLVA